MKARRAKSQGFTLLELVLVMVILATMMAVAVPSLRGFWAGARTRDAATELLAVIRYGHMQAVADSQVYRLNWGFEDDHWAVWLTKQDGTEFVEADRGWGRHFAMPDRTELQCTRAGDTSLTYVEFQPSGRVDPASLKIVDQGGMTIEISCLSPTEQFRLVTNAEK